MKEEFELNKYVEDSQQQPRVAGGRDKFATVWESNGEDGSGWGIYARLLNADGSFATEEFRVNETTENNQRTPDVAFNNSGEPFFVWAGTSTDGSRIFGRIFKEDGTPLSGEVSLDATPADAQENPQVVGIPETDYFVVVWQSKGLENGEGYDIVMRKFDAKLNPLSDEVNVNTIVTGDQKEPSVSATATSITVCWTSYADSQTKGNVMCRIFDAKTLAPKGDEFFVNQKGSSQTSPFVGFLADGSMLVLMNDKDPALDGSDNGLSLYLLSGNGQWEAPSKLVNRTWSGDQSMGRFVVLPNNKIFVVWHSSTGDSEGYGVMARLLKVNPW